MANRIMLEGPNPFRLALHAAQVACGGLDLLQLGACGRTRAATRWRLR